MRIEKITSLHRNDFCAVMKCEYCDHKQDLISGYNDEYYHNTVIPTLECKSCGKSTESGRGSILPLKPNPAMKKTI